jgi:RNA polymerase sigma-70 factor (ECF subfamily)
MHRNDPPLNAGHEQVFREFQRGRLPLTAYIRSLVGDPDLAEDLFQEVSIALLQKLEGDDPVIRDVAAWSRGTARHLVYRERTRAKRLHPFATDRITDLVDLAFAEQERPGVSDDRRSFLARCMQSLAPAARELLDLRYVSGMSLRELGDHLDRTEGAVQVALSRIRRALLECIRRHERDGSITI